MRDAAWVPIRTDRQRSTVLATKSAAKSKSKSKSKVSDDNGDEKPSGKSKSLVIVESPGKTKTISKVLGPSFLVRASVGHVRDLSKSKKDDPKGSLVNGVAKDFTPVYIDLPAKK